MIKMRLKGLNKMELNETYLIEATNDDGDDTIAEVKVLKLSPSGTYAFTMWDGDEEHKEWMKIDDTTILEKIS